MGILIENNGPTALGIVVAVVAIAALAYSGKKLFLDDSTEDSVKAANEESNKKIAALTVENYSAKAEAATSNSRAEVALAKAEILSLSNEKERISLRDKSEFLAKQAQELENDSKALKAMEKRLKLEISKA